jgi:hypothetical protein
LPSAEQGCSKSSRHIHGQKDWEDEGQDKAQARADKLAFEDILGVVCELQKAKPKLVQFVMSNRPDADSGQDQEQAVQDGDSSDEKQKVDEDRSDRDGRFRL